MQNFEMSGISWIVGVVGFVVGFVVAYVVLRMTSGSVRKQLKTQSELKQVRNEVEEQKAKIETHFAESADILKSMAQNYQNLYEHLANSSVELLAEDKSKELFSNTALLNDNSDKKQNVTLEAEVKTTEEPKMVVDVESENIQVPKDYSK